MQRLSEGALSITAPASRVSKQKKGPINLYNKTLLVIPLYPRDLLSLLLLTDWLLRHFILPCLFKKSHIFSNVAMINHNRSLRRIQPRRLNSFPWHKQQLLHRKCPLPIYFLVASSICSITVVVLVWRNAFAGTDPLGKTSSSCEIPLWTHKHFALL